MLEILAAIGGIILVDLALSGDNALVIGAAAAHLPRSQRRMAIFIGGAGAIALRIVFAIAATLLLQLPLLQALGGLVLIWIAVRLLSDREEDESLAEGESSGDDSATEKQKRRGFGGALGTILVADVTMSLDNVLAVGALAAGHLPLLAIGLVLSMGLVLVGSSIVASLIERLPWLLDVAALVLGWTAANMVANDLRLKPLLAPMPWATVAIHVIGVLSVLVADLWLRRRDAQRRQASRAA